MSKITSCSKEAKELSADGDIMPSVRIHIWFEKNEGVFFGSGRYELLKKIDELGCLRLASESLGLSYRGAWGKLKRTEEIVGQKLIYKRNNKEGYMLTELGRDLTSEFEAFYKDVSEYASAKGAEILKKYI